VHDQQDIQVLSQFAAERVTQLRRIASMGDFPSQPLRRSIGEQLMRLGAWVAAEPTLRPSQPTSAA